jgi:hypothetical protein
LIFIMPEICPDDLLSRVCRACPRPFLKADDNHDQAIVLLVISFSLFSGLLLKTDTTAEDEYELGIFAAVLTAVNIVAIMVPPVHLAVAMYQKKRNKSKKLQIAPEECDAERPNPEEKQPEGSEQQGQDASARSTYVASDCEGEGEGKDGTSEEVNSLPLNPAAAVPPQQHHTQQHMVTPPFVQTAQQPPPMVPTVQMKPIVVVSMTQGSEMIPSPKIMSSSQQQQQQQQQRQRQPAMPVVQMMVPLQSAPAASRYAQDVPAGQMQPVLPAIPWTCPLCTFEHTLACCAAKATCCICGAGRPV